MGSTGLAPGLDEAFRRRRDRRGAAMDNSGNVTVRRPREFDHRVAPSASITADHAPEVLA